ncbi:MAG: EamA family transporter, partial [Candidatus Aenigmatarchaeota archaeon]
MARITGTFLAFVAAIISGFAIFANKIFIVNINPVVFTAIRSLLIGLIFLILSLHMNKWKFKGFKKVSWKYLLAIGIIGGGLAFLLF